MLLADPYRRATMETLWQQVQRGTCGTPPG
jgi:hypothetical protein